MDRDAYSPTDGRKDEKQRRSRDHVEQKYVEQKYRTNYNEIDSHVRKKALTFLLLELLFPFFEYSIADSI